MRTANNNTEGLIASVLLLATWPCGALGDVIVSLNNPGSTTLHEITVEPGDAFAVNMSLNTDSILNAVRLQIESNASDVFDVTEITPVAPWSISENNMVGGLDPETGSATVAFPDLNGFGPGVSTLATIQFSVDPLALQQTYTIDVREPWYFRISPVPENDWQRATGGPSLLVHVLPEPVALILLLTGAILLARRRPRQVLGHIVVLESLTDMEAQT